MMIVKAQHHLNAGLLKTFLNKFYYDVTILNHFFPIFHGLKCNFIHFQGDKLIRFNPIETLFLH